MFERRLVINNGGRTLCHPMQSIIIQVIYKIGGPQSVSPIYHSQVWLQTESDDSKSCYQLIITVIISENNKYIRTNMCWRDSV